MLSNVHDKQFGIQQEAVLDYISFEMVGTQ